MNILTPLLVGILSLSVTGIAYAQPVEEGDVVEVITTTSEVPVATTTPEVVAVPAEFTLDPRITLESIPGGDVEVGDFVVGPGRVEVTVLPGQSVTREITVTNRISDDRAFELMVEDMSGSADGKEAIVLLGDQDGPYSLRDYISFPQEKLKLDLGQRARIPVTITMPPEAEPGGYYGGVLVTTVQDDGVNDNGLARSPIVARIGTLFFISVPGETEIAGDLIDFSTMNDKWWYTEGPVDLALTYENTGSIHLNPYGEIRVSNMFGAEVGFLELEPWFVLPKSLRLREVTWDSELLLGRYTITANVNRGYNDIIDTEVIHIWVVPWRFLATVFGTLFFVFFIIRFFLRNFELKRK
jgi:hypothetical protein